MNSLCYGLEEMTSGFMEHSVSQGNRGKFDVVGTLRLSRYQSLDSLQYFIR